MPRSRKLTPTLAAWLVARTGDGWERSDLWRTGRVARRSLERWLALGRVGDPTYEVFAFDFDHARRQVFQARAEDRRIRGLGRWRGWCGDRGINWRRDR